jgi:hypothetical protein
MTTFMSWSPVVVAVIALMVMLLTSKVARITVREVFLHPFTASHIVSDDGGIRVKRGSVQDNSAEEVEKQLAIR